MTATEDRFFVISYNIFLPTWPTTLAQACEQASQSSDTNGRVYELADDGTVRLVAQMATVS